MLKSKNEEKQQKIIDWMANAEWLLEWHRGKVIGMLDSLFLQNIITKETHDALMSELTYEASYASSLKDHLVTFLKEDGGKNA